MKILAHFLPMKATNLVENYTKLYIKVVVRLHAFLFSVISNRGVQFIAQFWKSFLKGLSSKVNLSTIFHPRTNGQEECTIHTLEDMFRASVSDFKGNWDDDLPLIGFFYNNSYHSSIQIALYETLYG